MFVKNYLVNSVVGIFKPRTAHANWQPTSKRAFFILMGLTIVLDAWLTLGTAFKYLDSLMVALSALDALTLLALTVVVSGVFVTGGYWLLQALVRKINPEVSLEQIRQGYSLFYTSSLYLILFYLLFSVLSLWLLLVNATAGMIAAIGFMLILGFLWGWWLCNRAHWLAAITGSGVKASILPSFLYITLISCGFYFLEFLILAGFAQWHQLPWPTFMQLFGAA